MNTDRITGIRVVIWDFDGTFYPQNKAVTAAMEEGQYRTIMRHKGWDRQKAKEEFWKIYPSKTTSGNTAVGIICGIPTPQAAVENEGEFDRLSIMPKDHALPQLFAKLKAFRHFILGNGVKANLAATVHGLGLGSVFEEIVTSEVVGANKPDPAGFLYIMKKTSLSAPSHLMVGDREAVDLVPAKRLGMRTCLVAWGEGFAELPKTGESVDTSVSTVYDIPAIF